MAEPAMRNSRRSGYIRWLLLFSPSIFIVAFVIYPFITLVHGNINGDIIAQLTGISAMAQLSRKAISNSLLQGGLSALLSLAAGLPIGIFLGRYNFRFKRLINSVVIIPFFLPSIIVVFAFIAGFGTSSPLYSAFPFTHFLSSGLSGIIAINTFFNAPLVALFTMTAVEHGDESLNEAAKTLGSSIFQRFTGIWGRDALLAAAGASLLAFTYSFAGFAAPLIIGGPGYFTLDAWIYFMVKTLNNFQAAIVLALVEALILVIPALAYILFSSRRKRVVGFSARVSHKGGKRDAFYMAGALFTGLWIAMEVYLLSSVFVDSFSVRGVSWSLLNYTELFSGRATAAVGISASSTIVNTFFYGAMTSLLVVTLGLMWVLGSRRMSHGRRFSSEPLQYVPLVISSILLAFALSVTFGVFTPTSLVWVIIIIAQSSVAIPVVLRVIDSGFSSIPESYTEAALTMGGNPFFEVEMPMARSTFASALMFGFAISLGEFSATNFLATTTYIPLTVEMYLLRGVRLLGASFAAASLLLIISLVSFYVIQRLGEKFIGFR